MKFGPIMTGPTKKQNNCFVLTALLGDNVGQDVAMCNQVWALLIVIEWHQNNWPPLLPSQYL